MLFNSFEFLTFYLIVVGVYFALADRHRWKLLLAASLWFYMSWRPEYVVLLLVTTAINFGCGLAIERTEQPAARKRWLVLGIAASLSLLFTFKYLDFVSDSTEALLRAFTLDVDLPVFQLLLPLGISFYTFQAIGYTVDVYRRRVPAERHFGIFALYVSFFPQLVAGPIERSSNLLPQFRKTMRFDPADVATGLREILWGLVKKVVIADQISIVVDTVYEAPGDYASAYLIFATALFAVQIYCDFSGYSDMAIGTARIMGYRLMENFRRPYFSTTIGDFWRRWHISLMSWFRAYVYLSLGGFRMSRTQAMRGIMVVFLLSGIWHGANWTFVVWGLVHGVASVLSAQTTEWRRRAARWTRLDRLPVLHVGFQRLVVLTTVVLAFVFFRAQSLDEALAIFERIFLWQPGELRTLWLLGLGRVEMAMALLAVATLFLVEWAMERDLEIARVGWSRRPLRWACYTAEVYAVIFLGAWGGVEFIYFQF